MFRLFKTGNPKPGKGKWKRLLTLPGSPLRPRVGGILIPTRGVSVTSIFIADNVTIINTLIRADAIRVEYKGEEAQPRQLLHLVREVSSLVPTLSRGAAPKLELEEVPAKEPPEDSPPPAKSESVPAPVPEPVAPTPPKPKPKPKPKPEPKPEAKPEAKPEPKPEPKPEAKPEAKPEPKPESEPGKGKKGKKGKRARDEEGRYAGDDPETPDVNEAWVESSEEQADEETPIVAPPKPPHRMNKADLVDWLDQCGYEREDLEAMRRNELVKFGRRLMQKDG